MMKEKPYFMSNKEWFKEIEFMSDEWFELDRGYVLTDKAPKKAIDSYNEFYKVKVDENGRISD